MPLWSTATWVGSRRCAAPISETSLAGDRQDRRGDLDDSLRTKPPDVAGPLRRMVDEQCASRHEAALELGARECER